MSTKTTYLYNAFGLNLESDFMLNGLAPSVGTSDVRICEGNISVDFPGSINESTYWSDGNDKFAFRLFGLGTFLISGGNKIIIQSEPQLTDEIRELYILGTCMGALILQRGLIPIHGSTLSIHDKAVIITGLSGAGKSTLTASLIKQGHSYLADDISAVQLHENGEAWIIPAFPKQKLCADAAINIFGGTEGLKKIPGIRDKYHVPSNERFIADKRRLRVLFELSTYDGSEVKVEEIGGTEKLAVLTRNTFRLSLVKIKGLEQYHFQQCSKIASSIKVYKLKRPINGFTTDEQMNKIMLALEGI